MNFSDLFLDANGPLGFVRDAWWAVITAFFFGGLLPLTWRQSWNSLEKRKWTHLRAHFGNMLSWNHDALGKALEKHKEPKEALYGGTETWNTAQALFEKIQNEVGLYSSLVVTDAKLASSIGIYIHAITRLWYAIDPDYAKYIARQIPHTWEVDPLPKLLENADKAYVTVMSVLKPEIEFPRWQKWWQQSR
jgi:hypothetical protein